MSHPVDTDNRRESRRAEVEVARCHGQLDVVHRGGRHIDDDLALSCGGFVEVPVLRWSASFLRTAAFTICTSLPWSARAVFAGSDPDALAEDAGHVALVGEAALSGDVAQRLAGALKKQLRVFDRRRVTYSCTLRTVVSLSIRAK